MSIEVEAKRDSMDAGASVTETKAGRAEFESFMPQNRTANLVKLPLSVQSKIYAHVLDTEVVNIGKPNVSYAHTIKDGLLSFSASRPPYPIETALFYVNKQVGTETRRWFYKKNLFIKLDIYSPDARHAKTMLEDSGVLFTTADPELLDKCTQHAMDLTIVEKESSKKRASVMFPAQYLPRLINFMDQAAKASKTWAPTHTLSMAVRNTYDLEVASIQGDLLELFRMLSNFNAVTIDRKHLLLGYAEGLESSMTAASFNADTWLATVTGMKDLAIKSLENHAPNQATQHCQSVIISMTYAYLTHSEALHMKPDALHKAIQRVRYITELTLAQSLRQTYAELTASLRTIPSSPPPSTQPRQTDAPNPDPRAAKAAATLLAAESAVSHALSLASDSPSPAANPWFRSLPPQLIPPNKAEWFTAGELGLTYLEAGRVHMALREFLFAAGDLERAEQLISDDDVKREAGRAFDEARAAIDWKTRPGFAIRRAALLAAGAR